MRYFEDFQVGDRAELGSVTVSADEIVAFARQFDPQPFHVDAEAARGSAFGGLVASGWHTASLCMRLMVDGVLKDSASMGSPGVDELRWLKPVRPGDTLRLHTEVLEARPSQSKPDRGTLRVRYELLNQKGEVAMQMVGLGILQRRPSP